MADALHFLFTSIAIKDNLIIILQGNQSLLLPRNIDRLGLCLDGTLWINPDNDAVRVLLPHLPAYPGRSAACAGTHHDHVHLAIALLEDLLCSGVIVCQGIAGIAILGK